MATTSIRARPDSLEADRLAAHRMFAEVEATVLEVTSAAGRRPPQDHLSTVMSRAVQMLAAHTEQQVVSRELGNAPEPESALVFLSEACGMGLADWAAGAATSCTTRDELQQVLVRAGSAFTTALMEAVIAHQNNPET